MIGRLIGNYKILEQMSCAETFAVYKAVDLSLERSVVIKALKRESVERAEIADAFRLEAAILAKLDHPCVPSLHSLTTFEERLLMISEFAEGETLDRVLLRDGAINFEKAVAIFTQILDCVEYAHKTGIAHGELKTSHIMLTDAGRVKVLGFGASENPLSAEADSDSPAPTNFSDREKDVRALALMLYESLNGKPGIETKDDSSEKTAEPIKLAIKKALLSDNAERFRSVAEFRRALIAGGFVISTGEAKFQAPEKFNDASPAARYRTTDSGEKTPYEKFSAFNVLSFSPDEDSRAAEKEIALKRSSPNTADGENSLVLPLKKSGQKKRYKIAGAAIFAILVAHIGWQFFYIRSENLRAAEEVVLKNNQPDRRLSESKQSELPVAETPLARQTAAESLYKAENSDVEDSEKSVQTAAFRRSASKTEAPVAKKKPARESKPERLRRAEKLLTGM